MTAKISITKHRKWILVLAHTLALIWATYYWLNLPYTYENEGKIISWSSIIKNIVLGLEDKPANPSPSASPR